jgi:hypothetical protein
MAKEPLESTLVARPTCPWVLVPPLGRRSDDGEAPLTSASGGHSGPRACWTPGKVWSGTRIPAVLLETMLLVDPVRSLLPVPFGEEAGPLHVVAPTGLNQ